MTVYSKYVAKRLGAKSFTDFSAAWPAHYSEILKSLGTSPVPSQENKEWVIASMPDFSKYEVYQLFKVYL